jgi:hypothetical protein
VARSLSCQTPGICDAHVSRRAFSRKGVFFLFLLQHYILQEDQAWMIPHR